MLLGGELSVQLLNVLLLTLLLAPLLLWRYRRAVLAGMAGAAVRLMPAPPAQAGPLTRLPPSDADTQALARLAWERRMRRRIFLAALFAVAVPALALAAHGLWMNGFAPAPLNLWMAVGVSCSAAVPIFAVLTATPWWRALRAWLLLSLALAVGGVALAALLRLIDGRGSTLALFGIVGAFYELAANMLWAPLLLGLAIGARRVRGVAPIVFAALLVFGLGQVLAQRLTHWLGSTQLGTEWLLNATGLDTGFVLIALPIGLLAWQRLKALAHAYEAKTFSDAQLLAGSWWLLMVVDHSVQLISVHAGVANLLTVLAVAGLAYAMFAPLLRWGLRRAYSAEPRPAPRLLLLLRVFGDTARTEALFDRTALRWQLFGPVAMIAAPDVIARTVDPGDILRFALGHLDASFVNSAADLERRIATLDRAPDPDGRHRVNEFCCRESSWQATVVALMHEADTVLMDLRGFDSQRMGCEFELHELARRLDPRRVVLVVDATTDRTLLEGRVTVGEHRMVVVDLRHSGSDAVFEALLRAGG